jgi:hypothetical protein
MWQIKPVSKANWLKLGRSQFKQTIASRAGVLTPTRWQLHAQQKNHIAPSALPTQFTKQKPNNFLIIRST